MNSNEQTPPHNLVAERVVIGSLLKEGSQLFEIADVLKPYHFFRDIHGQIYSAIVDIGHSGRSPSISKIMTRIGEEYDDGKSVRNLLTGLLRDASKEDGLNPLDFLDVIIECWSKRQIANTLQWALKAQRNEDKLPDILIGEIVERFQEIGMQSQARPLVTLGDAAREAYADALKAQETGQSTGMDWFLPSATEVVGRIAPGDFGAIMAAQGDGKTVIAVQLLRHISDVYGPAVFFQLEMKRKAIAYRELSGDTDTSYDDIEGGCFDLFAAQKLEEAVKSLQSSRLYIESNGDGREANWAKRRNWTLEEIVERLIYLKKTKDIRVCVIDHLRKMKTKKSFRNEFDRTEYITGTLKDVANVLNIAIIALVQRTRLGQRRDRWAPRVDDMVGGPSIEQDADWILGAARPEVWLDKNKPHLPAGVDPQAHPDFKQWLEEKRQHKGKIELYGLKRRRGAGGIMRDFIFDGAAARLREI
ncbi:replicative DNA helicase [Pseudovibrio japonicus]|uniref:DNA 5'-3' helicase n=1 Tax=Pseudovibrio japonicus TaxID=366534 RepID=A0ABQ3EEN0_9HYPH|nr:DnaB-like helicase C-terminal domain-containing protein [Pseudovibrio japonicus]GHB33911.1 replicative DNA helicase [Pseudovibrio japonicus]